MQKVLGKRGLKLDQVEEIKAALKEVNGKGYDYAVTEIREIVEIAKQAEAKLEAICLPQSSRNGVTAEYRSSGGSRPYKSWTPHRRGTRLSFKRFKDGWRVMSVEGIEVYGGQDEKLELTLDAEQRETAERNVFRHFRTRREYPAAA